MVTSRQLFPIQRKEDAVFHRGAREGFFLLLRAVAPNDVSGLAQGYHFLNPRTHMRVGPPGRGGGLDGFAGKDASGRRRRKCGCHGGGV
jgi:hypothetical protein